MKILKKPRFKTIKYETGQGWFVWDTKLKRTYRAFINQDDARHCTKILNNNKQLNQA